MVVNLLKTISCRSNSLKLVKLYQIAKVRKPETSISLFFACTKRILIDKEKILKNNDRLLFTKIKNINRILPSSRNYTKLWFNYQLSQTLIRQKPQYLFFACTKRIQIDKFIRIIYKNIHDNLPRLS